MIILLEYMVCFQSVIQFQAKKQLDMLIHTKLLTIPLMIKYMIIYICNWKNIDEEKHCLIGNDETKFDQIIEEVMIENITDIEAIMYSNPRWGTPITNKFNIKKQD